MNSAIKVIMVGCLVGSVLSARAQEQQARRQPGWPCAGTVDRNYARTAEATGGKVLLFRKGEIGGAVYDTTASSQHPETVFRASAQVTEGTYEVDVPIDSTIESAYFFVSLQCLESVEIVRASGDTLAANSPDVEYHRYTSVHMATVRQPLPGSWRIKVRGRGVVSVVVSARTDLRLDNVRFTDGGEPVRFAAKRAGPVHVETRISDAADRVTFQFMSSGGAIMSPVDLDLLQDADGYRTYGGDVTLPETEFRLAVSGADPRGFAFQRVQSHLVVTER